MKLSLLILSLTSRSEYLKRLLSILDPQKTNDVEILIETDEGNLSIGEKRNRLLQKSKGEYIAFIDDDDLVAQDYVSKILEAIKTKPDCVGIHLLHFNDGNLTGLTYHNLKYDNWFEQREDVIGLVRYYRNPNHLNPVKREYAIQCFFPKISHGEDKVYSTNILKYLHTQEVILEPIYYYFYRSNK